MNTLAHAWGDGGGPGPWILLFPLIWALVIGGGITVLRRTVWRGRSQRARSLPPWPHGAHSPLTILGGRFASGDIDEDEYWRRLSVLDEEFGRGAKGGAS
ncbi:SHOCT domain-containing protein [Streptomyces zagrosensis]|uniref:Putative membrane protein n=1 Tax=Streptomyces zagrosensis TaxID=1042984 RepID=A0A7W9Q9Z6_9ACTN|nr:SHOCT domain-containing protein [Streptomyces zagrosensis]MBB5935382.1 putative membrane protein [Streptomyces zagrosensis]